MLAVLRTGKEEATRGSLSGMAACNLQRRKDMNEQWSMVLFRTGRALECFFLNAYPGSPH